MSMKMSDNSKRKYMDILVKNKQLKEGLHGKQSKAG